MKTITTSKGKFLFVEVSVGACNIGWPVDYLCYQLPDSKPGTYKWLRESDEYMRKKGGEYQFICTTQTITEEQAKEIVGETVEFGFYATSVIWLDSLIKAHDLKASNYAILKTIS